jgi:predicted ester cyclase
VAAYNRAIDTAYDFVAAVSMPATGRAVLYESHEFYRVENGLIAEEWICSDMASLFSQLS